MLVLIIYVVKLLELSYTFRTDWVEDDWNPIIVLDDWAYIKDTHVHASVNK